MSPEGARGRVMSFVVVSLYTPDYREKAERLAASCTAFGLPTNLIEAPAVHASISRRGSGDLSLTKPVIISKALERWAKPVLWLDADMVIRERPERIESLAGHTDLAIYNWLADEHTDAWRPLANATPGKEGRPRFWEFRHAIDYFDQNQLFCSGGTQLWSPGEASAALLDDWQATIAAYPGVADDECLDFAFNNRDNTALRREWLGKDYVRLSWWPQVRPVIDHPDMAGEGTPAHIPETGRRKRFYPERAKIVMPPPGSIPRAAIIDVEEGWLLRRVDGGLVRVEPANRPFWP